MIVIKADKGNTAVVMNKSCLLYTSVVSKVTGCFWTKVRRTFIKYVIWTRIGFFKSELFLKWISYSFTRFLWNLWKFHWLLFLWEYFKINKVCLFIQMDKLCIKSRLNSLRTRDWWDESSTSVYLWWLHTLSLIHI